MAFEELSIANEFLHQEEMNRARPWTAHERREWVKSEAGEECKTVIGVLNGNPRPAAMAALALVVDRLEHGQAALAADQRGIEINASKEE